MKYIQFFVALLAVSIFVGPAMSMQDNGNKMNECKPQIAMPQGEQQCDCQNSAPDMGNKNSADHPMMDGKLQNPCGKNPEMGPAGDNGPKNMMDGKLQNPCGKNPEMGPAGDNGPKNMMDGKLQNPCGKNPEMGPAGDNGPE
jgi:hypothetical protein